MKKNYIIIKYTIKNKNKLIRKMNYVIMMKHKKQNKLVYRDNV